MRTVDNNESFVEAVESLCFYNPPSDPNTSEGVPVGSNSSNMQPQESPEENRTRRSEDICFNNLPSNPKFRMHFGKMERCSSMPPQERSEITTVY
jgi:hypothetical protein